MALGSGISASMWGGLGWVGVSGYTVHVNNQPMIVLLVPFRKRGFVLGGSVKLGGRGAHINVFSSYLFLLFSLFGHPILTHLQQTRYRPSRRLSLQLIH